MHRFFLSHSNNDKELAEIIANTLKRSTLNQISSWFSSDESADGGLKPGNIWFNSILEKLTISKAVVAILTPNSISRPWIYFESGIGQTLDDCEIIPICIGINKKSIYPPLGLYQTYQLSDYRSFKEFISKLLSKFDIPFDEERCKPILEESISKIVSTEFPLTDLEPKTEELIEDLKSHIDKRFIEFKKIEMNTKSNNEDDYSWLDKLEPDFEDTVISIDINLPKFKSRQFIEIRYFDTFMDVKTRIDLLIKDHVTPNAYLQSWIIRDKLSDRLFVIREIDEYIPARYLIRPKSQLEVISLEKPYSPEMSRRVFKP